MSDAEPEVPRVTRMPDSPFVHVEGTFHRAVDPAHEHASLDGSRSPGRYSPAGSPTLYLSSSPAGVAAAMIAHADDRAADLLMLAFQVHADRIADLRDPAAMDALGVDPSAAAVDWQAALAAGRRPVSWDVRERLERAGAAGLIDPSRKRPGLWHLTLFRWNAGGASPRVRTAEDETKATTPTSTTS